MTFLKNFNLNNPLISTCDTDQEIQNLSQVILQSAIKSRKPKSKTICKMPWSSRKLCAIRNQLRKAQVFQLCPAKENRSKLNQGQLSKRIKEI